MAGRFALDRFDELLLNGRPSDYLSTPVFAEDNRALLEQPSVLSRIIDDPFPIPKTKAREGYFGDRHLEYWLSGYRDVQKLMSVTHLPSETAIRILDFGGASGRVARHLSHAIPNTTVFLSDINPSHVGLVRYAFKGTIHSFQNSGAVVLPFADGYLDCVTAFSVFTHINFTDLSWLLELRRVVRRGGKIYLTIHDQATWDVLPNSVIADLCLSNPEFKQYRLEHPVLGERVTHFYSDSSDYSCNVFVTEEYVRTFWAPLFQDWSIASLAHDHQSALCLTVG